jgi:energy-coupling factor transporter ATP-binding protein EcfA2
MRVTNVSVRGLFGVFDHDVPLQSAERVTIIYGPNGFGKTVILRMILGLIEGKAAIFEHTPFREFAVTLDDGSSRIIRRFADEDPQSKKPRVLLEFWHQDKMGKESPVTARQAVEVPQKILRAVDSRVPGPWKLSGSSWVDAVGRSLSLEEILDRFPEAAEALPRKYLPGLTFDVSQELEAYFVKTNRLDAEATTRSQPGLIDTYYTGFGREHAPEPPLPRVKHYSDDIVQRIRSVLADYARHSQERDRTFPERLVRLVRDGYRKLPEREILNRMAELEKKRRRLISLGLLAQEGGLRDLTEEDVRRAPEALTIYVGDIEEKLNVFDDLARRIGALMDIVNARFKYKHLTLTREQGFRVFSIFNQLIELQDLSSGEQHELVVLYELLFRAPNGGLILVDEPEISLHVGWQSRFIADLISILEPTNSYAIVATHSPVIIGTRSDLTVELTGPDIASGDTENVSAR